MAQLARDILDDIHFYNSRFDDYNAIELRISKGDYAGALEKCDSLESLTNDQRFRRLHSIASHGVMAEELLREIESDRGNVVLLQTSLPVVLYYILENPVKNLNQFKRYKVLKERLS